ncbi:pentapeptide repeat-containing protein [Thermodesulfobacteriota bacterium]
MTLDFVKKEDALKVIQRLRDNPKEKIPPVELNFKGVSLRGEDLTGLNLMGANFVEADLSEADLSGAHLFKADFSKASLVKAKLNDVDLTGANLSEANLEDAHAERAGLGMATLKKTRMFNAILTDATLTKTDLMEADLRHANLSRVRLREAELYKTDCTGADFRGADMSLSNFAGAIMNNTDMRDTRLRQVKGYEDAKWYGVDIRDINFAGAYRLRRFVVDENYLKEFRDASKFNHLAYKIWSITSDCGRSLNLWCLWILVVVVLFSVLYAFCGIDYGKYDNWIGPFYYSVVTITTLGYGDIVPATPVARIIAICEVCIGYILLGGLLSIFTNKMARRGE